MFAASWAEVKAAPPRTLALMEMPVDRGWSLPDLLVVAARDPFGSRALTGDEAHGGMDMLLGVDCH